MAKGSRTLHGDTEADEPDEGVWASIQAVLEDAEKPRDIRNAIDRMPDDWMDCLKDLVVTSCRALLGDE